MKIEEICLKLDKFFTINFSSLFDDYYNIWEIIVTFLAILELVKQKIIFIKQHKLFGDIKITKREQQENGE